MDSAWPNLEPYHNSSWEGEDIEMSDGCIELEHSGTEWMSSQAAVNTVFLPRHLPDNADKEDNNNDCTFGETNALKLFASVNDNLLPDTAIRMLHNWNKHFRLEAMPILNQLKMLKQGDTFPIHLPAQNAALTLTRNSSGTFTVRGYNVQPEACVVMETGAMLNTKQPCVSLCVDDRFVLDVALIDQLANLQTCTLEGAMAKTTYRHTTVEETREAISPRFVFDWLFGVLSVLNESNREPTATVAVSKKVRDRVMFWQQHTSDHSPWRRHRYWLAFKFILHGTLVNNCGQAAGTVLYKAAMLNFMAKFLECREHSSNSDLCQQMMAKVAVRLHKLNVLMGEFGNQIDFSTSANVREAMNATATSLQACSTLQHDSWKFVVACTEANSRQLPNLSLMLHQPSVTLTLTASGKRIFNALQSTAEENIVFVGDMEVHASGTNISSLEGESHEGTIVGLQLWEEKIFRWWLSQHSLSSSRTSVLSMLSKYEAISSACYHKRDPIGKSRRLLTATSLIALSDVATTAKQPLLLKHKPGVSVDILQGVLATDSLQLRVLQSLESHFHQRNNDAVMDGPLNASVSHISLSSHYAQQDIAMKLHRSKLLEDDKRKCEVYKAETKNVLAKFARDELRYLNMCCKCERQRELDDPLRSWEYTKVHSSSCSKWELNRDLLSRERQVFEWCMPDDQYEQQAIVFELLLPTDIQLWRDALWYYHSTCIEALDSDDAPKIKQLWTEHLEPQVDNEPRVTLGSTNVAFAGGHYGTKKLRHATLDSFILPCNLNCHLSAERLVLPKISCDLKEHRRNCTFKVEMRSLQQFVTNTSHHQSQVIAEQGASPDVFNRREFITYGSVRCAERLQWHSILRGIHDRSLLIHHTDVVKIICQCVWQAGSNQLCTVLRETHHPLSDHAFVLEFTAELGRVLDVVRGNWQQHWSLCAVVAIANRLLDIQTAQFNAAGTDIEKNLQRLLAGCRQVAVHWLDEIKSLLEAQDCEDGEDLQLYAARIATFGAMTYESGTTLNDQDNRPLQNWLRFVTDMHNNMDLNQSRPTGLLEVLYDHVLRMSVKQHEKLCCLLNQDSGHFGELNEFITWFYCPGRIIPNHELHRHNQLWISFYWRVAHGKSEYVQIDLRQGRCWINGLPLGRLPRSITQSDLFLRHFGQSLFVVKPCTSPHGQRAQTNAASETGCFVFSDFNSTGKKEVSIYEPHGKGTELRNLMLLSKDWFCDFDHYDIPADILEKHSIWIDIKSHEIFFRPVSFRDPKFPDLASANYILNFANRAMGMAGRWTRGPVMTICEHATVGVEPGSCLIDQSTPLGITLVKLFSKLELPKFIELWLRKDHRIYVCLPRLNLTFFSVPTDHRRLLHSADHSGWCVAEDQTLGTLVGLENGLVMVKYIDTQYSQRCFLMPHAQVFVQKMESHQHQSVSLSLETLGNPPLFRYAINSNLKQLEAPTSHAAWFFLAYLHAITASVLTDPFTTITGTEMAMSILQSSRCWSNSPFDGYSKYWLHCLSCLSPKREFYPKHKKVMEIAVWPTGITSMCASDAYVLLVDRIVSYSESLRFLFPQTANDDDKAIFRQAESKSDRSLTQAAYLRSFHFYPILARLTEDNSPDQSLECEAFPPALSPSSNVQNTAYIILSSSGKPTALSADAIETALLPSGCGSHFTFTDLDVLTMRVCSQWSGIDLQRVFKSFQMHVETNRDCHRLHLALMLSFWSYINNQKPCLLDLAIALCNRHCKLVKIPASTNFPCWKCEFPSCPSIYMTPFVMSVETHATKHGLEYLSRYETDESVISAHEHQRKKLSRLYDRKQQRVKGKLQIHVSNVVSRLNLAPIGYEQATPRLPKISLDDITDDILNRDQCHAFLTRHFEDANLSLILAQYAAKLAKAVAKLPLAVCRLISSITDLDVCPRRAENDWKVCVVVDIRNQSATLNTLQNLFVRSSTSPPQQPVGCKLSFGLDALLQTLQSPSDPIYRDFAKDLQLGCEAMHSLKKDSNDHVTTEKCSQNLRTAATLYARVSEFIVHRLELATGSQSLKALKECGLLPRTSPSVLLRVLLAETVRVPGFVQYSFSKKMVSAIGGMAVQLVLKQRCERLLRLPADKQEDWFQRELVCIPHTNWLPCEHVEWLLFEVENDLTIWPKQVSVAKKMMSSSSLQHSVVQLNMGEGKTSVILPIIAAEMANGRSLVRVVVLNSLYNTNYQQLVFKLGGLLGHRVLSLPFRRDIRLKPPDAKRITSFLKQCRGRRDVMVTVREHLLSLLLKYEESCSKEDMKLAKELHRLDILLQRHARDVLDEADEVLHHRFQLIYPIGVPQSPDGGDIRWKMAEVILEAVKVNAKLLHEGHRNAVIYNDNEKHAFPHLRILESKESVHAYRWLCEEVVTFIMAGRGNILKSELMDGLHKLPELDLHNLKHFLLAPQLDAGEAQWFRLCIPNVIQPYLLCVRGLLANGVLLLALKKRFRVEYGLPSRATGAAKRAGQCNNERLIRMAVPFRAKDVAAERTEFGHTDVAVMLTLLSYYQYGLTDDEVNTLLDRLDRKEAKSDVYNSWVAAADTVDSSIQELGGINRKNATQMKKLLIPFLRHHTAAINFYLGQVIFPNESKEFKCKLVANSWSMAPVERCLKMSGFSGTNDTRHLLPGSTKQDDLPELRHTNAYVCNLVLDNANNMYRVLRDQPLTGEKLLDHIVQCEQLNQVQINTIVDIGALVLDFTNLELAKAWLEKRTDKNGVVYFDSRNQLQVWIRKTRSSCKLELSSYADNLTECLVYLDHAHCRGTDLRMKTGTVAAITLGKGLRRDELMQACMRMRRLGKGHTLTFWAPLEVDALIRRQCKLPPSINIENHHVVRWCFSNSISATQDGFFSWATQGLSHFRVCKALYGEGRKSADVQPWHCREMAKYCVFPDCMTLDEMYGQVRNQQPITEIIQQRSHEVHKASSLVEQCRQFVPGVHRFAQALDEEQEREMEQEIEEEKQVERPPIAKYSEEKCSDYLLKLVATGHFSSAVAQAPSPPTSLWQCLQKTSLSTKFKSMLSCSGFNSRHVLATKSFSEVVVCGPSLFGEAFADNYLRPVFWLLYVQPKQRCVEDYLLVLSPFQADRLVLEHLKGNWSGNVSLLMYSSPVRLQQSVMADWSCTVAGKRIPRLCTAPNQLQRYFTEVMLYSGGLFFGTNSKDMMAVMENLASLLQLSPGPRELTDQRVSFSPDRELHSTSLAPIAKRPLTLRRRFSSDPILFLRDLLAMLRSADSCELSHIGSLLLRHSWPQPPSQPGSADFDPSSASSFSDEVMDTEEVTVATGYAQGYGQPASSGRQRGVFPIPSHLPSYQGSYGDESDSWGMN